MESEESYTLFGVEGSYYAAKARSYLLRKGIPFREIQADRKVFKEIIVPRIGYPIVPVLLTPEGETLQDTAEIVDALELRHPSPAMIPTTPRRRLAAYLMELYADEWLKVPALHYRWFYDDEFAHMMMGYNNDPQASPEEQRRVGTKIAAMFRAWPEHLGATHETRAAVEANFRECLALLDEHFAAHRYFLGSDPSLADCAMMGPLYAHLYRDPYSGTIVRREAPALCAWIERMRASDADPVTGATGSDVIPATALELLRHLGRDYVPVLESAIPQLQRWLRDHTEEPIPRYAGSHRFTLGRGKPYQAEGTRSVHSFEQWKVQRVLDVLQQHPPAVRGELEEFCAGIQAQGLLALDIPCRLERRQYALVRSG